MKSVGHKVKFCRAYLGSAALVADATNARRVPGAQRFLENARERTDLVYNIRTILWPPTVFAFNACHLSPVWLPLESNGLTSDFLDAHRDGRS